MAEHCADELLADALAAVLFGSPGPQWAEPRIGQMAVGSESTRLIVLRGNSGSGKSTVAKALLDAYGGRSVAWVAQDLIRRTILREKDRPVPPTSD